WNPALEARREARATSVSARGRSFVGLATKSAGPCTSICPASANPPGAIRTSNSSHDGSAHKGASRRRLWGITNSLVRPRSASATATGRPSTSSSYERTCFTASLESAAAMPTWSATGLDFVCDEEPLVDCIAIDVVAEQRPQDRILPACNQCSQQTVDQSPSDR